MINSIQLIKESLKTYKINFKNIFWVALPIFVLGVIIDNYVNTFTNMIDNQDFSNISNLITSLIVYIIAVLIMSLYLDPVLNRSIQKKEDGQDFDTSAAYAFQKKNVFKWIMVNIWGFLYLIRALLPYITITILLSIIISVYPVNDILSIAVFSLIGITLLIGIILNISKFILYKNIFFSKDEVTARDAVRESIELGKNKNSQIWTLIFTLIISNIVLIAIYFLIGFALSFFYEFIPSESVYYFEVVVSGLISTLFILPLMYIITAKGYVKIRG